jgi:hypothetical protein
MSFEGSWNLHKIVVCKEKYEYEAEDEDGANKSWLVQEIIIVPGYTTVH